MNIHDLKQIKTPRLIIRPVEMGDEIELNEAIQRTLPSLQRWMPCAKEHSLASTRNFVQRAIANWQSDNGKQFPMVVLYRETKKIIAASGFNEQSNPDIPCYEIGYWIDSKYQGKGLVTEFVNALTRFALKALNAQRVQIRTQASNEKSINVAKRCGYSLVISLKNDRLDCVSGEPTDSLLFACFDTTPLPPLDVNWTTNTYSRKIKDE